MSVLLGSEVAENIALVFRTQQGAHTHMANHCSYNPWRKLFGCIVTAITVSLEFAFSWV